MKKNGIALAIILIILVLTLVACSNTTDIPDKDEYVVTIHPNNGNPNVKWDISDPIPKFEKEGFEIEGYYLDSDFTIEVVLTSLKKTGINGDIDVYIKWKKEACEHDVVIDDAVPATCTEKGLTEGKHCSKCGEVLLAQTEVPALGHTSADAVKENEIAPTCTTAGSYDSVVYCSVCDAELSRETKSVDALDHNIVNHNAQAPTCTEVGWEAYETCSRCDHSTYVEIPATGHNHVPAVTAPTCTEKGYTTYTCACGDSYIANEVPATGHSPAKAIQENVVAATCTTTGSYDSVVYCDTCGKELSRDAKTTNSLGHNIADYEAKEPTCTENGWEEYEACSRCNYTTYVEIPAIGHDHEEVVTDPTCTEKGYTTYTCHCGDTYVADEVAALGHAYADDGSCSTCGYHEYAFELNEDGESYTITGLGEDFEGTEVVIPAEFNGKKVTTIGQLAFNGCDNLTSIVIPDSVTTIGADAFRGCSSLESLTIPFVGAKAGVTSSSTYQYPLGYLFGTSSYTGGVATEQKYYGSITLFAIGTTYYIPSSLKSVIVTGGNILYGAFYNCNNITNITLGDDVTTIGSSAFYNCTSLTSITIPDSVTTIGSSAFYNCTSLTGITIPDSVTTIGRSAFYECTSLTSIVIPDSVTTIGRSAFYECTSLTNVTFGANSQLTSIGDGAFYACTSLTSITIPDSVTTIGGSAFEDCTSLTDVYYTGDIAGWCSITFAGSSANPMCNGGNLYIDGELIDELVIPSSLTSISKYAFYGCTSLTSVTFEAPNDWYVDKELVSLEDAAQNATYLTEQYSSYAWIKPDEDGFLIDGTTLIGYLGDDTDITIPDSVTSIGDMAFYGCTSLTSITIPDSVTSIVDGAFLHCTSLTSITIPDSVTTIGEWAFWGCTSLTSVTFGENSQLTTIGDYAFCECTGLTSITIPSSVEEIGSYAFAGCTSLTSIVIPDSVTTIGRSAFYECTSLTNVTFGENSQLTTIGEYAFCECTGLTSITIPSSVEEIGSYAFSDCTSLTSVTFEENSQTYIYKYAFSGCTSLKDVYFEGTEEQWWDYIRISSNNDELENATIHYNYVAEEN